MPVKLKIPIKATYVERASIPIVVILKGAIIDDINHRTDDRCRVFRNSCQEGLKPAFGALTVRVEVRQDGCSRH